MTTKKTEDMMTITQFAKEVGRAPATIRTACEMGDLDCVKEHTGRKYRWLVSRDQKKKYERRITKD